MDKTLQKILGIDEDHEPKVPGTRGHDVDKVVYVLLPKGTDASKAFRKVSRKVRPPIPQNGGVLLEHWYVKTPVDEVFYPLLLVGEIESWRRQIEMGAEKLGLKTASIKNNYFTVANGPSYPISDCVITRE